MQKTKSTTSLTNNIFHHRTMKQLIQKKLNKKLPNCPISVDSIFPVTNIYHHQVALSDKSNSIIHFEPIGDSATTAHNSTSLHRRRVIWPCLQRNTECSLINKRSKTGFIWSFIKIQQAKNSNSFIGMYKLNTKMGSTCTTQHNRYRNYINPEPSYRNTYSNR